MERFEVPDYDGDGNYLTRWRLIQTPWFGIYLHRFDGPDPRPTLHDHPWNFLSVVLRGGYIERRLDPMTRDVNECHRIRFVNRLRTHDAHAITRLLRVPTWTLMFVGVRRRTWGYSEPYAAAPDFHDAWSWTEFNLHAHAAEFDAALARRASKNAQPDLVTAPTKNGSRDVIERVTDEQKGVTDGE
jgi:hypothetical protein